MNSDYSEYVSTVKVVGGYRARPAYALGTCGFYPYPWIAIFGRTQREAIGKFVDVHRTKMVAAALRGDLHDTGVAI